MEDTLVVLNLTTIKSGHHVRNTYIILYTNVLTVLMNFFENIKLNYWSVNKCFVTESTKQIKIPLNSKILSISTSTLDTNYLTNYAPQSSHTHITITILKPRAAFSNNLIVFIDRFIVIIMFKALSLKKLINV